MKIELGEKDKRGRMLARVVAQSKWEMKLLEAALLKAKDELGTDDDAEALVHVAKRFQEARQSNR